MKYKVPPSSLFIGNRAAFSSRMQASSIAIFHANDLYTSNGDATYRFQQDKNLYYLTGIDQEEIILILFPDAPEESMKEMLFIRKSSPSLKIWEGWKYSKEEAREASGIKSVYYYKDADNMIQRLSNHFDKIYIDINRQARTSPPTLSAAHRMAKNLTERFPAHQLLPAAPIMEDLRVTKQEEELIQMKQAIKLTANAFSRVMRSMRPGIMEYELEADILYEFHKGGADGTAFDSIVASGKNACVLHYVLNDDTCEEGELVLFDLEQGMETIVRI